MQSSTEASGEPLKPPSQIAQLSGTRRAECLWVKESGTVRDTSLGCAPSGVQAALGLERLPLNKQPNQTHVPLQAPESPATWQREDVSPVPGWQH